MKGIYLLIPFMRIKSVTLEYKFFLVGGGVGNFKIKNAVLWLKKGLKKKKKNADLCNIIIHNINI